MIFVSQLKMLTYPGLVEKLPQQVHYLTYFVLGVSPYVEGLQLFHISYARGRLKLQATAIIPGVIRHSTLLCSAKGGMKNTLYIIIIRGYTSDTDHVGTNGHIISTTCSSHCQTAACLSTTVHTVVAQCTVTDYWPIATLAARPRHLKGLNNYSVY
jgi:hypothetical protein